MEEKVLIKKSQNGHIESFELLIRMHDQKAFNIAYRITGNLEDAKDATQDALIKAYQSIQSFKGQSKFSTWLYQIVTHTCIDLMRKRKKHKVYFYDESIETKENYIYRNLENETNDPDWIVQNKEKQRMIKTAINILSKDHKMVIVLRDIEGLSYDEISKVLDCSKGTVKSRINRARQALRRILQMKKKEDREEEFYEV